jgi:hypothetical protein
VPGKWGEALREGAGRGVAHADGPRLVGAAMAGRDEGAGCSPEVEEFVRYCYARRPAPWPDLYDEMCLVAARGDFRGMCYEQLEAIGIGFALGSLPQLARVAQRVVAEERGRAVDGARA